jgi:hypothetical protein
MKKILLCCLLAGILLPLYAEKPKRYVEFGLDVDAGLANNYLGFFDIFNAERTIIIDPSELADLGYSANWAGEGEAFFNINFGEKFGLGVFAGFDTAMYSNLSKELFEFLANGNAGIRDFTTTMSAGGSSFVNAGLRTRFQFGDLSLTISPAAYVPIIYASSPRLSFHLDTSSGTKADISMAADVYTPLSLDKMVGLLDAGAPENSASFSENDIWHILESWGLDLSLDAEYALNPKWDLGGSVASIPLYPATLRHGVSYRFDYTLDILGGKSIIDLIKDGELEIDMPDMPGPVISGDLAFRAFRPLRFDFYVQYKPASSRLVVFKPNIGFSALTVYGYDAAGMCFNAGLEAQLNLKRIFSLSLSSGYRERIWRQGAAIMLNLRVFQLDVGVSLQSQDFVESFKLKGLRAAAGLRFGF